MCIENYIYLLGKMSKIISMVLLPRSYFFFNNVPWKSFTVKPDACVNKYTLVYKGQVDGWLTPLADFSTIR